MTREQIEVILNNQDKLKAFCEGKLQYDVGLYVRDWSDTEELVIDSFCRYPNKFRIKPEPKLRPWTKFPVGGVYRMRGSNIIRYPSWHDGQNITLDNGGGGTISFNDLFEMYEHSFDGEKFSICGTYED